MRKRLVNILALGIKELFSIGADPVMDRFRNRQPPKQCRSSAVSRALHEKLRKDLRNVIGLYNREWQIRS